MKIGTINHPKLLRLQKLLKATRLVTIGALEALWHFTTEYATDGAIGKHSDDEIALGCYWEGDAKQFIEALVESGWLDRDEEARLRVHDWEEHAPRFVQLRLSRQRQRRERQRPTVAHTKAHTEAPLPRHATPVPTNPNPTKPNHALGEHRSADAYEAQRDTHGPVGLILAEIPENRRQQLGRLKTEISRSVRSLKATHGDQAVQFLIDRLRLWMKSHEFKSAHHRLVVTWLADEGYDEPESAWKKRAKQIDQEGW